MARRESGERARIEGTFPTLSNLFASKSSNQRRVRHFRPPRSPGSTPVPKSPRRLLVLAVLSGTTLGVPHSHAQDAAPGTIYQIRARVLPQERRLEVSG